MKKSVIVWIVAVLSVVLLGATVLTACDGGEPSTAVVESLTVTNGNSLTATVGDAPIQIHVKIKYASEAEKAATSADVTFESSNKAVAEVNADGLVTVKADGSTDIYIDSVKKDVSGGTVRATVSLTVSVSAPVVETMTLTSVESYSVVRGMNDSVQGITNDTAQIALTIRYAGETERAAAKEDVTFESTNPAVASVDENGKISFLKLGTTTIKVRSKMDNQSGTKLEQTISVEVKKPESLLTPLKFTFNITPDREGALLSYTFENITNERLLLDQICVRFLDSEGKSLTTDKFGYLNPLVKEYVPEIDKVCFDFAPAGQSGSIKTFNFGTSITTQAAATEIIIYELIFIQ